MRAAAVLLVLGLVACAPTSALPERSLQIACATYADTLNALATRNRLGLLSGATQDRVDEIDAVTGPICDGSDTTTHPVAALDTVEAALIALIEAKGGTDGQ